jgi:aerobic carbon-monoxide dehydrogenase small subunit
MRSHMIEVKLTVNGKDVCRMVETRQVLAKFLRNDLHLTGTHIGCDTTQCGCCTVLLDGDAVKSCTMLAVQASGRSVTTIEGLSQEGDLHPVQKAFHEHHALQCGYCTPGFVMSTVELVSKYDQLTDSKIRELIDGNICRCTGYQNIVLAIKDAASTNQRARLPDEAGDA